MFSQRTFIQSSIRPAFSIQPPRSFSLISDHTLFCGSMNFDQSPALPTHINKCATSFMRFIHSTGPKEFDPQSTKRSINFVGGPSELQTDRTNRPMNFPGPREFRPERTNRSINFMGSREFGPEMTNGSINFPRAKEEFGSGMTNNSMNFVSRIVNENRRDPYFGGQDSSHTVEQHADIVHIKLIRNNTFITLTDSKGNKKAGALSGCLAGGGKVSRYAAEATAEHMGRVARSIGLKSVVVKVNGFTLFKKKKQTILGFREGFTHSRGDQNPVVYIEDTTRKPHN